MNACECPTRKEPKACDGTACLVSVDGKATDGTAYPVFVDCSGINPNTESQQGLGQNASNFSNSASCSSRANAQYLPPRFCLPRWLLEGGVTELCPQSSTFKALSRVILQALGGLASSKFVSKSQRVVHCFPAAYRHETVPHRF